MSSSGLDFGLSLTIIGGFGSLMLILCGNRPPLGAEFFFSGISSYPYIIFLAGILITFATLHMMMLLVVFIILIGIYFLLHKFDVF